MPRSHRLLAVAIAAAALAGLAALPASGSHDSPPAGVAGVLQGRVDLDTHDGRVEVEVDVEVGGIRVAPFVAFDPGAVPVVELGVSGACDPLDPAACLLPFPNDIFTEQTRATDTGRRVAFDLASMPRNVVGKPIDPTEWNRNDGFSPSTPILARVPGLDLAATRGTAVAPIQDMAGSLAADSPVVLLDATTGERWPHWYELDQHSGTPDGQRLLIVRPAVALREGHRYVVGLRNLRNRAGELIAPAPTFAAYRDGAVAPADAEPGDPDFAARRPHMEQIFAELSAAGVGRDELYLAWDFTVASERNLSERVLSIRDDAFARLGDPDLADRQVEGRAPTFTVTSVEELPDGPARRVVEGTITVPNYLTPQAELSLELPEPLDELVGPLVDPLVDLVTDALDPVAGALPIGIDDLVGRSLSLPMSRFNLIGSEDGLPVVNPLQPTVDVPFVCKVARTPAGTPSEPTLYGHGLLGHRNEALGSSTERLLERGYTPCAVDWWGMSFADLPNVVLILLDPSNFASLADRGQQGFVNFLYLGRAMVHPDGFASHRAFRAGGEPLLDGPLVFNGNSQGAIMGGALTALAPDYERAVLGVPGMAYSTLLNRSVDWEGAYGEVFYLTFPDPIDRQLGFGLLQMLWDRAESSGYAQHMTTDPLPNTPPHEVFLQVAFADHQVANVAAEVEGRTIGARYRTPPVAPGEHWAVDPAFGFDTVHGDRADVGSVLVYWHSLANGNRTPPNGNVPPRDGSDPHGDPRKYPPAADQIVRWLRTGDFVDVCGAGPCVIPEEP